MSSVVAKFLLLYPTREVQLLDQRVIQLLKENCHRKMLQYLARIMETTSTMSDFKKLVSMLNTDLWLSNQCKKIS
jgi:hypothetical protein